MTIHHDKMAYGKLRSVREELSVDAIKDMVSVLNEEDKKRIKVVAACFIQDGKVYAVRRSYGNSQVIHKFEFVGGKQEEGETAEQALIRECQEEMSLSITIQELFCQIDHNYPDKNITLYVFLCHMASNYVLKEHEEERWIPLKNINYDEWAPADKEVLIFLQKRYLQ